jgi:hypothetical protein
VDPTVDTMTTNSGSNSTAKPEEETENEKNEQTVEITEWGQRKEVDGGE